MSDNIIRPGRIQLEPEVETDYTLAHELLETCNWLAISVACYRGQPGAVHLGRILRAVDFLRGGGRGARVLDLRALLLTDPHTQAIFNAGRQSAYDAARREHDEYLAGHLQDLEQLTREIAELRLAAQAQSA